MTSLQKWIDTHIPRASLDAAGIVALADVQIVAERTAIVGKPFWLDPFVLCPGLHRQQNATDLNKGEYPATGALTTNYVFRVENQATVVFLQKIGLTGYLTNVEVSTDKRPKSTAAWIKPAASSIAAHCFYLIPVLVTLTTLSALVTFGDRWGAAIIAMLVCARACNTIILYRRSHAGWKGQLEPGVEGDLVILMSQDRWIRMRGLVDDLKMVTSGQWLRDMNFVESSVSSFATLLVYLAAALAGNASLVGKLLLLIQLLVSATCLAISNQLNASLGMHGCVLKKVGTPKKYQRRLILAKELIDEVGTDEWAIRLGMITSEDSASSLKRETFKEQTTM
ncbi:MAG: hypothetical protein Q9160_006322 [Pyrenula sp. 1 TL-2023]